MYMYYPNVLRHIKCWLENLSKPMISSLISKERNENIICSMDEASQKFAFLFVLVVYYLF